MDENSTPDDNIYINAADGLSNDHPVLPDQDSDSDNGFAATDGDAIDGYNGNDNNINEDDANADDDADGDNETYDDLPSSLIVTNIHADVFVDDQLKGDMEELFRFFSPAATFQWLKSFRRLRVLFDSGVAAANARIQLHQYPFGKSVITCYFAQPVTPVTPRFLKPPAPFRQFLISPPASPPAGWEPRAEGEPLVNHDLLAALANLTPGESHQLHHPRQPEHPAIVVHTALLPTGDEDAMRRPLDAGEIHELEEEEENGRGGFVSLKARIPQTACPARTS